MTSPPPLQVVVPDLSELQLLRDALKQLDDLFLVVVVGEFNSGEDHAEKREAEGVWPPGHHAVFPVVVVVLGGKTRGAGRSAASLRATSDPLHLLLTPFISPSLRFKGKSSVINALLGKKYLAEGILPTTNEISILR